MASPATAASFCDCAESTHRDRCTGQRRAHAPATPARSAISICAAWARPPRMRGARRGIRARFQFSSLPLRSTLPCGRLFATAPVINPRRTSRASMLRTGARNGAKRSAIPGADSTSITSLSTSSRDFACWHEFTGGAIRRFLWPQELRRQETGNQRLLTQGVVPPSDYFTSLAFHKLYHARRRHF